MIDKKNDKNDQELKALKKRNQELEKELHRKEKALAEAAALLLLKKTIGSYGGPKGRLILKVHRLEIIPLIDEAHGNGTRYHMACKAGHLHDSGTSAHKSTRFSDS
ncbi:MAG: hypothetical protein WCK32_08090, partial [Chlorobiaceae bacterium]